MFAARIVAAPRKPWPRSQLVIASTLFGALALAPPAARAQASHQVTPKAGVPGSVKVPFDRRDPSQGSFSLEYELGRPFVATKPTVFVVADGQQFYVRRGMVAPFQDELLGDSFNVVGIIGRGSNNEVAAKIRSGGQVDWLRAYAVLRADQWIDDIEAVRTAVVGKDGAISLYGRSGGGLLVDQYLARYPDRVRTVFTQAAVNRFVDARFQIASDRFWDEIGADDPALHGLLLGAIQAHPAERDRIMLLLQRQNYFAGAEALPSARAALIHALAAWNEGVIRDLSARYQVDAILKLNDPAGAVRVFELFAPAVSPEPAPAALERVDPDLAVGRMFGAPLFALLAAREIEPPSMDLEALRRVHAGVYMLAGFYDHTADYASQVELSKFFARHKLLLLNDDHDFIALSKTGLYPALVQAALRDGPGSRVVRRVEEQLAPLLHR